MNFCNLGTLKKNGHFIVLIIKKLWSNYSRARKKSELSSAAAKVIVSVNSEALDRFKNVIVNIDSSYESLLSTYDGEF